MAFVLLSLKSSPIAGRSYSTESPPISAAMSGGRCNTFDETLSLEVCHGTVVCC